MNNVVNDLVPSVSIENLLQQRDVYMEKMTAAVALIEEANDIASQSRLGKVQIDMQWAGPHYHGSMLPKDVLAFVRRRADSVAWGYLMDQSGLKTFMDSKARSAWKGSTGSTLILRTLPRRLIMAKRSVHVQAKKIQPGVQARSCGVNPSSGC